MVTLTSSKVILRPYRDEDIDSLVRHANNYKIWKHLTGGFPHPYTEASGRQWLQITQQVDRNINLAIETDHQVGPDTQNSRNQI